MTLALVFLVLLSFAARGTQAAECLEPASRVISRWKNGNYYKGEIESITNRVNVLFDNGARRAYNPRDNVDIVVDRIPDHTELPWGSQILVNRPKSRAFEIGYIRDIKNGRFVILYENSDMILHTLDQIRAFNKSQICDEPAYLGCFRDNLPRDLQVYIPTHPATIGACVDTCKSQGFSVGALRNSDLCFCGNAYRKANQVADKECDMPCYDNSFEVCGGFMTFSQYWTGIVDSETGTHPGIQKHFIPSNDPIPWELLMHARSKYPPRHLPGSTRGSSWYQTYASPWRGNTNIVPFQQQRIGGLRSYPSTYQAKLIYRPQNRYQGYQRYYGAKPYTTNYNQLQQPSSRYNFQIATNTRPSAYGAYQSQANRWPYNYNYNSYKYRNYNFQNSAAKRPYNGYQGVYQRRPAPRPSAQEEAKLMGLLKKVSWTLFKEIHGTSKLALGAPRFLGCYQDSVSRDLPTAVQVRPLTVEGCVSKCGESGFSIAGLQSSTQCFCGATYSKYGRLRNDQCTMRCTGNYQEICGGVMMNSLYYTGIGQAIPYVPPPSDARTQQITFTKNTPTNALLIAKSGRKQGPFSLIKPTQSFHKVPLQKAKPKVFKGKDKLIKGKPKKTTQLKHKDDQSKGRPLPIQDYGKLTKILQKLSRWRQPHKSRDNNKDQKMKPALSYQELRKVLDDMTPEIVKKIADKIIAHDNNRTRLSDMKPLPAEKSLQVHLESSKLASEKKHDLGFKRVQVKSSNYKNWSKKGNSTATKVRNKHEDLVLEEDARPVNENGEATKAPKNNTSKQSVSTTKDPKVLSLGPVNGKVLNQSTSQNKKFSTDTQESMRYATKAVFKVQTADGTKIPSLPSFIPIADKRKQHRLKSNPVSSENHQNGSRQLLPSHNESTSDELSNKRTFVHFIVKESHDKKRKVSKKKNDSSWTKTHSNLNKTKSTDDVIVSHSQEKAKTQANASQENQTAFEGIPFKINPAIVTEDVDEVFGTNNIPSNNKTVENDIKSATNSAVQTENKTLTEKEKKPTKKKIAHPEKGTKTIVIKHPRIPHKVLHVEAKWNGQINVKANWKEVMEPESKPKKKSSVKNNNENHKTKPTKKFKESSGDDEGNDEYKFDDSGSRNELLWRHNRPLKDKVT